MDEQEKDLYEQNKFIQNQFWIINKEDTSEDTLLKTSVLAI